jgi:hypothetical protein
MEERERQIRDRTKVTENYKGKKQAKEKCEMKEKTEEECK